MKVRPVPKKVLAKVKKFGLDKAFKKAVAQFEADDRHPSLHYEIMRETRHMNPVIHSFRITHKYRVEGYELGSEFQIINVTSHYQ